MIDASPGPLPDAITVQAPASPYSSAFPALFTFNAFPAVPKEVSPVPPLAVGKVPAVILLALRLGIWEAVNPVNPEPLPEKVVALHTPD